MTEMTETPVRRPMTFSFLELLDRTFRLYRENFLTIIGVVAVVTVPISLITYFLNQSVYASQSSTLRTSTAASGALFLISILGLVQAVLTNAPVIYIASEYLFNHKVSIGEAFSGTSSRFTKMGCGIILLGIFIVVVALLATFLVAAIPPALALLGILIYIFVASFSVFFQVITLEDIGASAAITRSYTLGKRSFWTVVGLSIVVTIIGLIVTTIINGSSTFLINSIAPGQSYTTQTLLITLVRQLVNIFTTPISLIAFTLLYYDIRTRTEGLDIMLDSSGPAARPLNFAPPENRFRFDGHDWRNIAILTAVGLVVGLLGSAVVKTIIDQYSGLLRR